MIEFDFIKVDMLYNTLNIWQKGATMAEEKPLEKMTVKELRDVAHGIEGLEGVSAMKKEALLIAIKEARGIPIKEERQEAIDTIVEVKKKIRELRERKTALRNEADKAGVKRLRRKINKLKKKTRKLAGKVA